MLTCYEGGEQFKVPVVDAYQHLGRVFTSTLLLEPDIDERAAQAVAALRPISAKFFRHPAVTPEQKVSVARAYLISILAVGASGWHKMCPCERKKFHTKVL